MWFLLLGLVAVALKFFEVGFGKPSSRLLRIWLDKIDVDLVGSDRYRLRSVIP